MRFRIITILLFLAAGFYLPLSGQTHYYQSQLAAFSYPGWNQTSGPTGGYISTIRIDPANPHLVYAAGPRSGIYRSIDGGESWQLLLFGNPANEQIMHLELDESSQSTLYCSSHNDLLVSEDRGNSWRSILTGMPDCQRFIRSLLLDAETDMVYIGTGVHGWEECQGVGGTILLSANHGANWVDIGAGMQLPERVIVEDMALLGQGEIIAGINDQDLSSWHRGKVFLTRDNGENWSEVDFGATEDRFIWSVFANPHVPGQVWVTEGPLYNDPIEQPFIYRSDDNCASWQPVFIGNVGYDATQIRVIGASDDGRIYVAAGSGLLVTSDKGSSFSHIEPALAEITAVDMRSIAIDPFDSNILYLPARSGGIGYSVNGGASWSVINNGILNTNVSLLATDPVDPAVIYSASVGGEGTFRSDDYGESWIRLNTGGIVHPWGDELQVDPVDPDKVWFISDVPFIQWSQDRGNTWIRLNAPYEGGNLNFSSIYAMGQSEDEDILYATNNGFGIFKGSLRTDHWEWEYLNLSDVDYTYSLAVEPGNADVIYSGYSRKPFESTAKVMASYNGGQGQWERSLEIEGAEAVTSVVIDRLNPATVYAASTGEIGGMLWKSPDRGGSWQRLNEQFNFTTIHSFATPGSGSPVAYAGVWGGGTYKTTDSGASWTKLDADESFSAAGYAFDPFNPQVIYLADRTAPVLYRSTDGGASWSEVFDAGTDYRRLMCVTAGSDVLYVTAMQAGGFGQAGSVFRLREGQATDITGSLPSLALSITADPADPATIYAVTHGKGVYKSADGGNTWGDISGSGSGLPGSGFTKVYIKPGDSATLYLIGGNDVLFSTVESAGLNPDSVNGVYRSTDGGASWENINRGVMGAASGAVKSLAFNENGPEVIYAAAENGLYYTLDGGQSWTRDSTIPYTPLGGFALSGNRAYAYTNGAGLFTGTVSGNHAITWDTRQKIVVPVFFAQLLLDPTRSQTIYASAYPGGIFKSGDGGASWHEKNFGMASFQVDDPLRQGYYALDISRSDPSRLYLGLYRKGVYRSNNGADTWYPVNGANQIMAGKEITALAVDPTDKDIVFVATEDGVYRSSDGGQDWNDVSQGLASSDIKTLHFSSGGALYAGSRGYGIYRWNGGNWEAVNGFGNFGIIWPMWNDRPMYQYTSLLIHPEDNSRLLIGTFPQGIYSSSDGGQSWRESNVGWTNDGVFYLITRPGEPETVYAGTYNGVNRSLDFGAHWEMWDNGWPDEQWVFSIDFEPSNPDIMYACSKNGEEEGQGRDGFHGTVMKSIDGGTNWFEITNGLNINQEFYKIIVDRYEYNRLYLACQHDGVMVSLDAGASWQPFNEGLKTLTPGSNGNNVTNTMTLNSDHSVLYFGTDGYGVFRRTLAPVLPVNRLSAEIHQRQVILRWRFDDVNGNFSRFNVYRAAEQFTSVAGMSPYHSINSVSALSFEDIRVDNGVSYYYAVTTVSMDGYENGHFTLLGPVLLSGNENPLEPGADCDFSGDGTVGVNDVLIFLLLARDNPADSRLDRNGDRRFSILDAVALLGAIRSGACAAPAAALAASSGTGVGEPLRFNSEEIEYLEGMLEMMELATEDRQALVLALYGGAGRPELPRAHRLYANQPNPFNPTTTIRYDVAQGGAVHVSLRVYDIQGRLVATLVDSRREPGNYSVYWDGAGQNGRKLASGAYFYRLEAGNFSQTRKMVLLK